MLDVSGHHIGRSWAGHDREDECPCPQSDCGLVLFDTIDPSCPQHHWSAAKSIRQSHPATKCPGSDKPAVPATPAAPEGDDHA